MRTIARIAKTRTNVFSEKKLAQKKACKGLDVNRVLTSLSNLGLVQPVRRRLWQTTPIGRQVAHLLEAQWIWERYGMRSVRR